VAPTCEFSALVCPWVPASPPVMAVHLAVRRFLDHNLLRSSNSLAEWFWAVIPEYQICVAACTMAAPTQLHLRSVHLPGLVPGHLHEEWRV